MNATEFAMPVNFPQEIASNPEWYQLARKATEMLSDEVRDAEAPIPDLAADWSVETGANGTLLFHIRLSEIPNDPNPAQATIALDDLRQDERLQRNIRRLWGELLQHRTRRLLKSVNRLLKDLDGE